MKPVLFFSHSSSDADRSQVLVRALEQGYALKMAFDARDLGSGRSWRDQLYRWLTGCHGGVVLLTANVLANPYWVLQEATLLQARAAIEADAFRLFVIADAAVLEDQRFNAIFGSLELDRLQLIKIDEAADWSTILATVVAKVQAEMSGIAAYHNDYYGLLSETIFDALAPLATRPPIYRRLSEGYAMTDAAWQALVEPMRAFAAVCARRLARSDFGTWRNIESLFNALQSQGELNERLALLGRLRSWWVPYENACRLAEVLQAVAPLPFGAQPRNIVLLQADARDAQQVAALHRQRIFAPYGRMGTWVTVAAGEETAAGFLARVQRGVASAVAGGVPLNQDELLADLADGHADGNYVFVHAQVSVSAAHMLQAASAFWPCLFVLTVPAAQCQDIERELGLAALVPPAGYERHLRRFILAEKFARDELLAPT